MEDDTMIEDGQETKAVTRVKLGFARKLASPSKKTRDKAISLLVTWMTSQKQVKEDELKKIWKGLFYCVWHSDKFPVQADLIERLSSLAEKLDTALTLHFFKVFLSTMRQEWGGIDRLRLDKFYLLLRKYLAHMFVALENSGWDADITTAFMGALLERTFLAKDQHAALGINLHYAEIFLEELEKFLPLRAETFRLLIEPFLVVSANTSDKSFLRRLREAIFGRLLDLSSTVIKSKQEGNDLDAKVELLGSMALSLPISSEAFKLASMPSTAQSNRRMLYELHEEFGKMEKLLKFSGITITLADFKTSRTSNSEVNVSSIVQENGTSAGSPLVNGISITPADTKKGRSSKSKLSASRVVQENGISDGSPLGNGITMASADFKKSRASNSEVNDSRIVQENGMSAGSPLVNGADCNGKSSRKAKRARQENGISDGSPLTPLNCKKSRASKSKVNDSRIVQENGISAGSPLVSEGDSNCKSSGKAKRVRFSLKKNLVWKPCSPLPPENLRVPPSATPRGSALKKGVPPGPVLLGCISGGLAGKGALFAAHVKGVE